MERRGGGGGRPWRPRGAARDRASSSSSSHGDRWRPSAWQPSPPSNSAEERKGGRNLRRDGSAVGARAEPVVDVDTAPLVGTCPDMCPELAFVVYLFQACFFNAAVFLTLFQSYYFEENVTFVLVHVIAKERAQREQLRDLAVFERVHGNPGRTSTTLSVKKFCRTMSTMHVETSDIRPLPVLQRTLAYLLDLVDYSDNPFEVIHDFVFDRTRSIRQDLCIQNIVNIEVIHMYEEMVHLMSNSLESMLILINLFYAFHDTNIWTAVTFDIRQKLCDPALNFVMKSLQLLYYYDPVGFLWCKKVKFHIISDQRLRKCCGKLDTSSLLHLNMEQLIKSLMTLYDLYAINRKSGSRNCNEAEFYSFYVFLQLGYKSQERDSISLWFRKMEVSILQSKEMKFVRNVLRCFRIGNYMCFFKAIATESSYLQFCLLEPVIDEVRAWALSYINYGGYKLHPYPLAELSRVLMMEESDLESLCHACGLETSKDEAGRFFLPTKQLGFRMPKAFQSFSFLDSASLKR
ncbi:hypothetical protein Taro_026509 [Colocasia esculenta]|uniref:SAC3/GANP/THP3 conserved domain-containing protein n=1 Tax=Colocasia esculenta TaxID=4460 RepID=A0A843VHB8_COLES|nr:hypothetical protein [Colocasia esculenta]